MSHCVLFRIPKPPERPSLRKEAPPEPEVPPAEVLEAPVEPTPEPVAKAPAPKAKAEKPIKEFKKKEPKKERKVIPTRPRLGPTGRHVRDLMPKKPAPKKANALPVSRRAAGPVPIE